MNCRPLCSRYRWLGLWVMVCAVMLWGVSGAMAQPHAYPYKIATTVGMVGDIVAQVAGE
jgi:ABC-type Zn uptake system ZnuABC Zn-binding protein ZnuA